MQQCLAAVTRRIPVRTFDDTLDLEAKKRDFPRTFAIGSRSKQAQKPFLTDNIVAVVEELDSNIVQETMTVYGRPGIGLGDDQPVL